MRTLALLAALTFFVVAFSGCSDGGGGDGDATSSSSSSSRTSATASSTSRSATASSSATSTSTAPSAENQAPTGSMSVAVNGTNATFTLDGSDPDGDRLVWDLDFGDGATTNGTTLPASPTHMYMDAGNFTAIFTITDGMSPVTYDLVIAMAAGGSGAPLFAHQEGTAAPGNPLNSLQLPVGWCGASCCAGFTAGESGTDCIFFEIGAELEGHIFTLVADAGNPDLEFWANCDPAELASVADFRNDGAETGEVPGGVGCVVAWDDGGAGDTPTFTFTVV